MNCTTSPNQVIRCHTFSSIAFLGEIRTRSALHQPSIAIAARHKCGERAFISQNNTTNESFEHGQPRILAIPTEPFGTHPWLLEVRKIPAHYVSFLTLYCPHRSSVHGPPA